VAPTPTTTALETREFADAAYAYRFVYPTVLQDVGPARAIAPRLAAHQFSSDGTRDLLNLASDQVVIGVNVVDNAGGMEVSEFPGQPGSGFGPGQAIVSSTELEIDGEPAIQVSVEPGIEGPRSNRLSTFIAHGSRIYSIWMFPGSNAAAGDYRDEYDVIVSSFEFTD
jgi:hypothetical protein